MKADIPDTLEEKAEFAKKLMKYSASLLEYSNALKHEETKYVYCNVILMLFIMQLVNMSVHATHIYNNS